MAIKRRGPDRYTLSIYLGQVDGVEQYEQVNFAGTYREAQAEEARLKVKFGKKVKAARQMTVSQWLDIWLRDYVSMRAPKTQENYAMFVRPRIKPALGNVPLRKLDVNQIQQFYARMAGERLDKQDKPVSPATVHGCHRVLRAALERAVIAGLIPDNPAGRTVPPTVPEYEPAVLTDEEADRFLEAARGLRTYAMYELALFGGLRVGEILGLTWADVDWGAKVVYVTKALKDVKKMPLFVADTKSKAGRRPLLMPDRVMVALGEHKEVQGAERVRYADRYQDQGLVFCTRWGTYLDPKNVSRRDIKRICKRAGLDPMRFHDLRHCHGTYLDEEAEGARGIANRLGHADPAFATRKYTHLTVRAQRGAVEKLNARFPAPKTPEKGSK